MSASASVASDLRLRGLSFSDRRPVAMLNLSIDHSSGAYVAVTGIVGQTEHSGVRWLGYQANAGYAARTASGLTWDVGLSNADLSQYLDQRYNVNYSEIYGGVAMGNVSVHAYFSPKYLKDKGGAVYLSVDGVLHPRPHWRLFGHAGLLTPVRDSEEARRAPRYDLRAGVAREFKHTEIELAWTHLGSHFDYPPYYDQARDAVVVSASYAF